MRLSGLNLIETEVHVRRLLFLNCNKNGPCCKNPVHQYTRANCYDSSILILAEFTLEFLT